MIRDLIFWKNWQKGEKWILFFCFVLILILLSYLILSALLGLNNIISWDVLTELKEKTVQTQGLLFDKFSLSATNPLWYVTESYSPSYLKVNTTAYHILLGGMLLGMAFILSGLSRLRGVWFLVGALLIALIFSTLRLESIFLTLSNIPFLIVFVFAGLIYYLSHNYADRLDILKTFFNWLFFLIIFIVLIQKWSKINEPLISLAAMGLSGALVVTLIFLFLISHEILAGLFMLVSENHVRGKNYLGQIIVVALVFIINVLLVYLENSRRIDKSALIFAPYILYFFSTILGLWGFKNLSEQRGWFTFRGVGIWLYLGMALISTATIGFAYATANESLVEFLEDFISISLFAGGIIFSGYVLINFGLIIKEGLPFHKIMYKPPFSRFMISRTVLLFAIVALFAFKKQFSLFQLRAGLDNAKGDFYLQEGDLKIAETYFKSGATYDLNNQRSNLALASLAAGAGDLINAVYFYHRAGERTPGLQAIIGESRSLEAQDLYFESIFTLKKGIELFPKEHRLYTNLAQLQTRAGITDSVLINLDKALNLCKKCPVENTNFLAFWIENGKEDKLDEMRRLARKANGYSFEANQFAIQRILHENIELKHFDIGKDSSLDMSRAAYIFNALSHSKTQNSTKVKAVDLRVFREKTINDPLAEALDWTYATQNYYREDKVAGIKEMHFLADAVTPKASLYRQVLGVWLLQEGGWSLGLKQLKLAGDLSSVELLSEAGLKENIEELQKSQAESLSEDMTLENYKEKINKAPLNPWLTVKAADLLKADGQTTEAYNLLLYARDLIPDSPVLLENYIKIALEMHLYDYAEEALNRLRAMINEVKYEEMRQEIIETRSENMKGFE